MRSPVTLLLVVASLVLAIGDVYAYPHFQYSTGNATCSLCHYAPAGGGLLTPWGRSESADTLSASAGDGAFLHGLIALPGWLDLGGNLRGAALINDVGATQGAEVAAFPMQVELNTRVRFSEEWSLIANVGLRGSTRQADLQSGTTRRESSALSYLISRDHYVYWKKRTGPYARAGRFYAPFGLRLPDHTSFVRRFTGFNLLEETYGLSGGYLGAGSEYHMTVHVSDELRWAPRREVGGTAMAEWHLGNAVLGASSRVGVAEADTRAIGGVFAKYWMEPARLLWMAEVDAVWQRFSDANGESRAQIASYLGPVWYPTQGLSVSVAYEFHDPDVVVESVERHAASFWVSFLPRSHFELMLSGRAQRVGPSKRAYMSLLQLHYYL